MQIDLVVETADAREVHHFALLFGYGASIINPYLSFSVIEMLVKEKVIQQDYQKAEENYINAINKGSAQDPFQDGDFDTEELPRRPDL